MIIGGIVMLFVGWGLQSVGSAFTTHSSWLKLAGAGILKKLARMIGFLISFVGVLFILMGIGELIGF